VPLVCLFSFFVVFGFTVTGFVFDFAALILSAAGASVVVTFTSGALTPNSFFNCIKH